MCRSKHFSGRNLDLKYTVTCVCHFGYDCHGGLNIFNPDSPLLVDTVKREMWEAGGIKHDTLA